MTSISVYQTPPHLPGERAQQLTTIDGTQIAWAARPDDRRGASLIFDGLAATGVDWRVNPPLRVDINGDGRHLMARLRVRGTQRIIITNAHYLVPTVRTVAIDLAGQVGADLIFTYEDGQGETIHGTGLLDDADRYDWPCYPEDEPPFHIPTPPHTATTTSAGDTDPEVRFPPVIATVGLGLFRAWNRHLLAPQEFAALDGLYCTTYYETRSHDTDPATISTLASRLLAQPLRAQSITALRAMQAALLRNGVIWRFPLSTLDAWRASSQSREPTDHDYERLLQLSDPQKPAVAVLVSLGYPIDTLTNVRLTSDGHLSSPNFPTKTIPESALMPLRIAANLNNGALVTVDARRINAIIRELTQQFDFPLPQLRGRPEYRRPILDPGRLALLNYRKDTP